MRRWVLLACALGVSGCGEPQSRTFAVTVTDSPTIDCTGHAHGLLADPEQLDELAKEARKAWKKAYAADPPTPQGRVLHVNELEQIMQAWFDSERPTVQTTPSPWEDGEPRDTSGESAPAEEPPRFDDPEVVYEGGLQDDFIEGTFVDGFNTDEADEEAGLQPCGPRQRVRGTLSLTTKDGVAGRVRWTDITYLASTFSACEGRIECARDISVEGLEVD